MMDFDIIIVGGGPAGLSFARAIAPTDLRIGIIEKQTEQQLADPGYDGREIALSHRSIRLLQDFGAWQRLGVEEIAPLRAAKVLNGNSPIALGFDAGQRRERDLGALVSNHCIRRTLFECISSQSNVTLMMETVVAEVRALAGSAEVRLADGRSMTARLLAAADSRFSSVRDQLGIGAQMKRTGTAMLVCRLEHDRPHDEVAIEWFRNPGTIAMLPLNGRMSSAVLTLPIEEARRLADLDDDALGPEIAGRFDHRLGAMRVASSRHVYPLVMTFSFEFAVPGAALIGDAAVGMHPVTAHGYNLGIRSADRLGREIIAAQRRGLDWSSDRVLKRYEAGHRRVAWPIYTGTNMIVGLYRDRRPGAMAVRHAGIRVARRMPFFRAAVRNMLLRA
jgi:ubiquinone biosynthesis UbiH/UbiF/VisC/COQ6 family hydroxylase